MTEKKLSPIQRHAQLSVASQIARSKGMRLNPQLERERTALETYARGHFSPQEAARAAQLSAKYQSEYQEQYGREQIEARERAAIEAADATFKRTAEQLGLHGRTREQIQALAKGEKVLSAKRETQAERDAIVRAQTKALLGKQLTEAQWSTKLNELSEATPQARANFATEHKLDLQKLEKVVTEWDNGGFLEHGLAAKRRERDEQIARFDKTPKQTAREPAAWERRGAQFVEARLQREADTLDEASEQGEVVEAPKSAYDDEIRDGKEPDEKGSNLTRRGALAAAYEEHADG